MEQKPHTNIHTIHTINKYTRNNICLEKSQMNGGSNDKQSQQYLGIEESDFQSYHIIIFKCIVSITTTTKERNKKKHKKRMAQRNKIN